MVSIKRVNSHGFTYYLSDYDTKNKFSWSGLIENAAAVLEEDVYPMIAILKRRYPDDTFTKIIMK